MRRGLLLLLPTLAYLAVFFGGRWLLGIRIPQHLDNLASVAHAGWLRQRRPREVQRLCADALAADIDPDDRATVLATVAMARHALLLSGRQQLDEALALDPDAELVSEQRGSSTEAGKPLWRHTMRRSHTRR